MTALAASAAAPLRLAASGDAGEDVILPRGPGSAGDGLDLYLEVVLNGARTHRVMPFVRRPDGHFYAWTQNLQAVGIVTDGLPASAYVDLARLPGLRYAYDALTQRMRFDATAGRLNLAVQKLNDTTPPPEPAGPGRGALLNYDLYGTLAPGGGRSLGAYSELRAFRDGDVLSSTGLSMFQRGGEDIDYRRLDTTWSRSFQDRLLTLSAGDLISGSLSWSRPTRLGGIQLRRNFGLQPQLVTFPLPAYFGQAALPSSVELYLNGVRQYSGQLTPGPFQLSGLPSISGAGQGQVVLTDALGRRDVVDFAYYSASQLLRAGLSDWSVELGAVRRDYGLNSFRYADRPAASGSLRRGMSDWLTLETHGEATRGLGLAGAGAVVEIGRAGLLSGSWAYSAGRGRQGHQAGLDYSLQYHHFNVEIGSTRSFGGYRDIASLDGRTPPLRSDRLLMGFAFGAFGNAALSYTRLDTREEGRQRFASLNYSVSLARDLSTYASVARSLDGATATTLYAGLSWSFGHTAADLSWQRQGGRDLYDAGLSRAVSPDGGTGWNLRLQRGRAVRNEQAQVSYRGDWGQVDGGGYDLNGARSVFGGLTGGLVLMDRALFATRQVDDGFALVSTDGVAGVPVTLENRPIGRTDAGGHYLLTGLNAWQPNHVAIDALALPAQIQVGAVQRVAVPADRAGVVVDFGLHAVRAATLILRDAQGRFLPLGSRVALEGTHAGEAMLGYDGEVYLEHLTDHNRAAVTLPDGRICEVRFDGPSKTDLLPVIGPLVCRQEP